MTGKFKQYTTNMGIIIKNTPIKIHHSINMVEWYHKPL